MLDNSRALANCHRLCASNVPMQFYPFDCSSFFTIFDFYSRKNRTWIRFPWLENNFASYFINIEIASFFWPRNIERCECARVYGNYNFVKSHKFVSKIIKVPNGERALWSAVKAIFQTKIGFIGLLFLHSLRCFDPPPLPISSYFCSHHFYYERVHSYFFFALKLQPFSRWYRLVKCLSHRWKCADER